jgi:cell division protein FtsB
VKLSPEVVGRARPPDALQTTTKSDRSEDDRELWHSRHEEKRTSKSVPLFVLSVAVFFLGCGRPSTEEYVRAVTTNATLVAQNAMLATENATLRENIRHFESDIESLRREALKMSNKLVAVQNDAEESAKAAESKLQAERKAMETKLEAADSAAIAARKAEDERRKVNAVGGLKGTLTYYFNGNYGDKPDSGAEVWLLTEEQAKAVATKVGGELSRELIPANAGVVAVIDVQSGGHLSQTIADGSGNFSMDHVPVGTYWVVIKSKHANGRDSRDILGKVTFKRVQIGEGQTVDASHDFGMTYLSY